MILHFSPLPLNEVFVQKILIRWYNNNNFQSAFLTQKLLSKDFRARVMKSTFSDRNQMQ